VVVSVRDASTTLFQQPFQCRERIDAPHSKPSAWPSPLDLPMRSPTLPLSMRSQMPLLYAPNLGDGMYVCVCVALEAWRKGDEKGT
jgi:hypothetical protein